MAKLDGHQALLNILYYNEVQHGADSDEHEIHPLCNDLIQNTSILSCVYCVTPST